MPAKHKCPKLSSIREDDSSLVFYFSEEEYKKVIVTLKNKKAAGIDEVLVEQRPQQMEKPEERLVLSPILFHIYTNDQPLHDGNPELCLCR